MLFASAGALRLENTRKSAMQHLFLFDDTVDKSTVRTPIGLLNACQECRTTSHTLTGKALSCTAISGVKSGKLFFAHTGKISQFIPYSSNNGWFFTTSNGMVDGQTRDNHAYRFVTVADKPAKNNFMDYRANMLGSAKGYDGQNKFDAVARTYFVPASRSALYSSKPVKIRPKSTMGARRDTSGTDYTVFTQNVETGFISIRPTGENFYRLGGATWPSQSSYSETSTPTDVGTLTSLGGLLMINPTYNSQRTWFANATWYNSYSGGQMWWNGNQNEVSIGLPYVVTTAADDPQANLVFGAIAVSSDLTSEMVIVDVGADLQLTSDTAVGTEPTFTCSQQMLDALSMQKSFAV